MRVPAYGNARSCSGETPPGFWQTGSRPSAGTRCMAPPSQGPECLSHYTGPGNASPRAAGPGIHPRLAILRNLFSEVWVIARPIHEQRLPAHI